MRCWFFYAPVLHVVLVSSEQSTPLDNVSGGIESARTISPGGIYKKLVSSMFFLSSRPEMRFVANLKQEVQRQNVSPRVCEDAGVPHVLLPDISDVFLDLSGSVCSLMFSDKTSEASTAQLDLC